jgi:hypothetical protein
VLLAKREGGTAARLCCRLGDVQRGFIEKQSRVILDYKFFAIGWDILGSP